MTTSHHLSLLCGAEIRDRLEPLTALSLFYAHAGGGDERDLGVL